MTHQWKIGDWCETNDGMRAIVTQISELGALRLCPRGPAAATWFGESCLKPLPLCDSWDWQPPSPPDPGEGYRPIDPAVDEPQEGDEIWREYASGWKPRLAHWAEPFSPNQLYRRKLPTYAPFTAESFKPHRDRWIRYAGHPGAYRIDAYDDYGYFIGNEKIPWQDLLDAGYVFDDTNTPCGVPTSTQGESHATQNIRADISLTDHGSIAENAARGNRPA